MTSEMPASVAASVEALTGCISGAATVDILRGLLAESGFVDVKVVVRPDSRAVIGQCMPGAEEYVASATIEAQKPGAASCCAPTCCS